MNAVADTVASQPRFSAAVMLRDWATVEWPLWVFVFKSVIAAFLALWIAYRFDIDNPKSAMLTVFIVAQPQSGLVVAKSFYRIVGTLVGLAVTLLFLRVFVQARELFILAVALWVGLCVAGAAYFRGFRTYGFLLAGYTTCLVGFPAALQPQEVFPIALSRTSDVLIGILCAGVIADSVFPEQIGEKIVTLVRGRFRDFILFARRALGGEINHAELEDTYHHFVLDALTLETLRGAAFFENPELRVRDERLRLFNVEFMAASTAMHGLHRWMERMRFERRHAIQQPMSRLYEELSSSLHHEGYLPTRAAEAAPVAIQLRRLRPRLQEEAGRIAEQLTEADRLDFECAADLLLRFAAALEDYTEAYGSLAHPGIRTPRRAPAFFPHVDPLAAALMGLRAAIVMLVVTGFWIAAAWPNGPVAVLIASVCCALFAQAPVPTAAIRQMGIGFFCGFVVMLGYNLAVLPLLDGFPQLALSLLPILMLSTWVTARPAIAGIGTGFNLMFVTSGVPGNGLGIDLIGALNDGFAQLFGVAVAGLAFSTLLPVNTGWFRKRQKRELRQQVAYACTAPLPGLRHRLEMRVRDLLIQLRSAVPAARDESTLQVVMGVLEIGDAVIAVRQLIDRQGLDVVTRRELRACGRALGKACEAPTEKSLANAREALHHADQRLCRLLELESMTRTDLALLREIRRSLYRLDRSIKDDPGGVFHAS